MLNVDIQSTLGAVELSEAATLERFNKGQDRMVRDHGFDASAGVLGIAQKYLEVLSEYLKKELDTIIDIPEQDTVKPFLRLLQNLDVHLVSLAVLCRLLNSIASEAPFAVSAKNVGVAIQGELWAKGLLDFDRTLAAKITQAVKSRHGSVKYRRQAARSIAAKAGYRGATWPHSDLVRAGAWLIDKAVKALPEIFEIERVFKPGAKFDAPLFVRITPEGLKIAEQCVEACLRQYPVFLPCTESPLPWTGWNRGGYWDERARLRERFARTNYKATTAIMKAAMRDGQMQPHVDGVNALQSVAWRINTRVLDVIKQCHEADIEVPGLPSTQDILLPARLSDAEWNDEKRRRVQRYTINQIKQRNRARASDRALFAQDMSTAAQLAEHDVFYTPMNCDWRGRVYSIPHFNFQRDDRVRALFQFAHGEPLGAEGLWWLKVHVANCGDFPAVPGGTDKISKRPLEERVKWAEDYATNIAAVSAAPLAEENKWWMGADKPFLFLAACQELMAALATGASTFVTHLPVSFDGSCSGLQHLCAMTRAPEGALVNLTPSDKPQDVYQTVADLVRARVEQDALLELGVGPLAQRCIAFGIDRKLVKRCVMTFAYSSKRYGMSQQQLEDTMRPLAMAVLEGKLVEHPFGEDGGYAAAKYLADHIYTAIETVVHRPAQAMAFLQKCAKALAHEGKHLSWITPTGLPWVNAYHVSKVQRVELWLSEARVRLNVPEGHEPEVDKDSAANGVSPNFVHALDAAHMLLTVNACAREGITSVATVHDSFGCLAPRAARFNQIIREQFVQMYETHDVLAEVLDAAKRDLTVHNWERLPEVPQRGALNLMEVLNARYAFA